MARCAYCKRQPAEHKTAVRSIINGKRTTRELPYCSEQCKQNLHLFIKSQNDSTPKFRTILMIWTVLFLGALAVQVLTGSPIFKHLITPVLVALIGAVLVIYPAGMMDLKYYERIGIKYFNLYIRFTGIIIIVTAANIIYSAFWGK